MDEPQMRERIEAVWEMLGNERDRGCVVIAAAVMDDALKDLLEARLVTETRNEAANPAM